MTTLIRTAAGIAATPVAARRDQEAPRRRVTLLRQQGGSYRSIAQAAGVAPMTVHGLAAGRTRPQDWTPAAVLAINREALPFARVDAGGTRLRLRALHVMG